MNFYKKSAANSHCLQLSFDSSTTKPDQDILHAVVVVFLQLAAVIRVTFTPFLLNFPQMLELVGSYLHDFIWSQFLLLRLDISQEKVMNIIIAGV